MPRLSAGLLMYRIQGGAIEVLLAHPGGPYFVKKDEGAWSIPKGEPDDDEDLFVTAQREFEEETGLKSQRPLHPLAAHQTEGWQDRPRLSIRGRLRSHGYQEQHLHVGHGRPIPVGRGSFPRSTGPSVRPGDGPEEDEGRAGSVDRRA